MKILVTGGAGFIGSHVADAYIEKGHEVVIIDNLYTGQKQNINPKAVFYEKSITDDLSEIFKKHKFDIVNHHAAQMNVTHSVQNPVFDATTNIIGTINLLQNSVKFGVKKFINVSSGGCIYGDEASLPIKENSPKHPGSPYGISKATAEKYVRLFSKIHGLKYTTLRYSNVYGPRQNPKGEAGVISIFASLMIQNKQPVIFGSGSQTRDYIYVRDIVMANLAVLEKGDNEAFNFGIGKETTVNELYSMIKEITGYKNNPVYKPSRPGELMRNCLDISKARRILGWEPRFSLEQGLKETVEWFKSQYL